MSSLAVHRTHPYGWYWLLRRKTAGNNGGWRGDVQLQKPDSPTAAALRNVWCLELMGSARSGRSPGLQVERLLRGNHLPMPWAQWRIGLPLTCLPLRGQRRYLTGFPFHSRYPHDFRQPAWTGEHLKAGARLSTGPGLVNEIRQFLQLAAQFLPAGFVWR